MVIWEKELSTGLVQDLKTAFESVRVEKMAVVFLIGSNIAQPGVLAKAATVLANEGINIHCISQSLRQVNIQFVIERDLYRQAVISLNRELCCNHGN